MNRPSIATLFALVLLPFAIGVVAQIAGLKSENQLLNPRRGGLSAGQKPRSATAAPDIVLVVAKFRGAFQF